MSAARRCGLGRGKLCREVMSRAGKYGLGQESDVRQGGAKGIGQEVWFVAWEVVSGAERCGCGYRK